MTTLSNTHRMAKKPKSLFVCINSKWKIFSNGKTFLFITVFGVDFMYSRRRSDFSDFSLSSECRRVKIVHFLPDNILHPPDIFVCCAKFLPQNIIVAHKTHTIRHLVMTRCCNNRTWSRGILSIVDSSTLRSTPEDAATKDAGEQRDAAISVVRIGKPLSLSLPK